MKTQREIRCIWTVTTVDNLVCSVFVFCFFFFNQTEQTNSICQLITKNTKMQCYLVFDRCSHHWGLIKQKNGGYKQLHTEIVSEHLACSVSLSEPVISSAILRMRNLSNGEKTRGIMYIWAVAVDHNLLRSGFYQKEQTKSIFQPFRLVFWA